MASFPSLRTLAHTAELRSAGVNVFGMSSKKPSVILTIKDSRAAGVTLQLEDVANAVLGRHVVCACVH